MDDQGRFRQPFAFYEHDEGYGQEQAKTKATSCLSLIFIISHPYPYHLAKQNKSWSSSTDLNIKLTIDLPDLQVVLIDEMKEDHHDAVGVDVHVQLAQTDCSAVYDMLVDLLLDVSKITDSGWSVD